MLNSILLQAAGGAADQGGGMMSILMIVALIAIFYFFMIRPQSKKQKEIKKFREAMQKGDKVTTAGGIHGKIKEIKDDVIVLQIDDNVKITVDKAMVYPSAGDALQTGADIKNNPS
ncbi:MAG: preprotein translocase subunit YajC [Muribaculaceae bacterium]|jgi:preprotein translocase subunit YajC|nr:preprotein translocase subunit YajC [Muribaculaceae bacterium]